MSLIQINWRPDAKELRKFGAAMLALCALAAGLFYWRGMELLAAGTLCFGIIAGGLGLTGTRAGLPVYWFWMGISLVLGAVVSPLAFAIFYFLVITPIGLVMRRAGRDPLRLRRTETDTYWVDAPPLADRSRHERQF